MGVARLEMSRVSFDLAMLALALTVGGIMATRKVSAKNMFQRVENGDKSG